MAFTKDEVSNQLHRLYSDPDPAAKRHANAYLMHFQEDPCAWVVAHELLKDPTPHVQFMGAQTLYLKVKRQLATLPPSNEAAFVAQLFAYLQDGSGVLQDQSCLRLALCISALAVRSAAPPRSTWHSALEDVVRFGREGNCPTLRGRYLATKMLASMPEELHDVPLQSGSCSSSPAAQILLTKVRLLAAFLLESIEAAIAGSAAAATSFASAVGTAAPVGGGNALCELSLQCLVQWTKAFNVRFCSDEAMGRCLVQLLPTAALGNSDIVPDVLVEHLLEVFVENLQQNSAAAAAGNAVQTNEAEGMCLRALLEHLRSLHPRLISFSSNSLLGHSSLNRNAMLEKQLRAWSRVVVMITESYTHLLFEDECEFLLSFLGYGFQLTPAVVQPIFEFWSQVKLMTSEGLLRDDQVQIILVRLTEPCVVSLLKYGRRDFSSSVGSLEEVNGLRDMGKDIICDIYCLWRRYDAMRAQNVVDFLSQRLEDALDKRDALGAEAALVLLSGVVDMLEQPLPACFVKAIRRISVLPQDRDAIVAAAELLQRCAPHMNAHVDLMPITIEFLTTVLPEAPYVAAETIFELTGYAGHHLVAFMPQFLAAVETIAPQHPVKVDATLYSAVVCTIRRLPASEAACSFGNILQGTMKQLEAVERQWRGHGIKRIQADAPQLVRLLGRIWSCLWTFERTPEHPDGPPPQTYCLGQGSQLANEGTPNAALAPGAARCFLAIMCPSWSAFAAVVEALLAAAPVGMQASSEPVDRSGSLVASGESVHNAAVVALKLLHTCTAAVRSAELPHDDAHHFVRSLLQLVVAILQHTPDQLSTLAPLGNLADACGGGRHGVALQDDFASALSFVCELTLRRLGVVDEAKRGDMIEIAEEDLPPLSPLFELLTVCARNASEVLYSLPCFRRLEQLAIAALGSSDRELNHSVLQFLLAYSGAHTPRPPRKPGEQVLDGSSALVAAYGQHLFLEFAPQLVSGVLQQFHKWPKATRKHSFSLFALLLERHYDLFHATLLRLWNQPGSSGAHAALTVQEREICVRLFCRLRGPRLKAFLGDLVAMGVGAQTSDVLIAYQRF